jgi:hypothetical protein
MAANVSVQEAVRQAREALGSVPVAEVSAWISAHLGLVVQSVAVAIVLGALQEKEILERSRRKVLALVEQARAEQTMEKARRKGNKLSAPAESGIKMPAMDQAGG